MRLELERERLLLLPLAETDWDLGIEMFTDPAVMKYVGGASTRERVMGQMAVVTRRCAGGSIGIWCVIERATEEKIGTAILLPLPIDENDTNWDLVVGDDLPDCEIEIGYILKQSAWGKGYATEAAPRLSTFALDPTTREEIVATTDTENTASQRVLEKCGLVYEGLRRAYARQCLGFRITRQRWLERNQRASRPGRRSPVLY